MLTSYSVLLEDILSCTYIVYTMHYDMSMSTLLKLWITYILRF